MQKIHLKLPAFSTGTSYSLSILVSIQFCFIKDFHSVKGSVKGALYCGMYHGKVPCMSEGLTQLESSFGKILGEKMGCRSLLLHRR